MPCITTISVDVDVHVMVYEPSDVSADETVHYEIISTARKSEKGDYVLVRFAKKQRCLYYAGETVQRNSSDDDDDIQTCFLKRTHMRKGASTASFCWSKKDYLS